MPVNYLSYLKVDSLLSLQEPQSDPAEHDEMLFIIIHQVYELWFRLLLHELDKVKQDFSNDRLHGAIATLTRVRNVLKTLVGQLDVLETMTPLSFSAFRPAGVGLRLPVAAVPRVRISVGLQAQRDAEAPRSELGRLRSSSAPAARTVGRGPSL